MMFYSSNYCSLKRQKGDSREELHPKGSRWVLWV
jgi:hypothetical protein